MKIQDKGGSDGERVQSVSGGSSVKKVIISGGGTGGHIFPALSIAHALKRKDPGIEILFVGALGKMEMEKVPEAGFQIVGLPVQGLRRKLTWKNLVVFRNLLRSLRQAKRIIRDFKPDVVVGVGGYASGPVGKVAARRGIPLVLQEQNSYAGVTNRLLAKKAARICVAYEGMERFFPAGKMVLTGNPVRANLLDSCGRRAEGIELYGLDPEKKTVLVTGGSLGAGSINKAMEAWMERMGTWEDVQVLWQCGSYYYDDLQKKWGDRLPANIRLMAFLQRMDLAYACADVVVARAGAGTISELCLLGKAAVLVPSPNVAEDHQTQNARALVDKSAAVMLRDQEVAGPLGDVLRDLLDNREKRQSLSEQIIKLGVKNSDGMIADIVLEIGKSGLS